MVKHLALMGTLVTIAMPTLGAEQLTTHPAQLAVFRQWDDLLPDPLLAKFETEVVAPLRSAYPRAGEILAVEFRSERVERLLPGLRVFVTVGGPSSESGPYVYDSTGTLAWNLDGMRWSEEPGKEFYRSRKVSQFVNSLQITVENEAQAIDVARLIEELQGAPATIGALRTGSRNFTLYDPRVYRPYNRELEWQYKATRRQDDWVVRLDYTGQAANIMVPATWYLITDGNNRVRDIHSRYEF